MGEELVGNALHVAALDVAQARRAEVRNDVVTEGACVASDRARFVDAL